MKEFEKQFGPPPILETAASSDIMTTTKTDYYKSHQRIWKEALEWVLDGSDDCIDRDMLNEEVGRELEN